MNRVENAHCVDLIDFYIRLIHTQSTSVYKREYLQAKTKKLKRNKNETNTQTSKKDVKANKRKFTARSIEQMWVSERERVRMMWRETYGLLVQHPHPNETIVNLLIHYILTLLLINKKKRISLYYFKLCIILTNKPKKIKNITKKERMQCLLFVSSILVTKSFIPFLHLLIVMNLKLLMIAKLRRYDKCHQEKDCHFALDFLISFAFKCHCFRYEVEGQKN